MAPLPLDSLTVVEQLKTPDGVQTAYASLESAWDDAIELLGKNPDRWRWGDLHRIRMVHPLRNQAPRELRQKMSVSDYAMGGSHYTANATPFYAHDFLVRGGASFRMVVDVGDWDASKAINTPGQSGDPRSRFYDNLLRDWATGKHFPLLYSKSAIDDNTALSIQLAWRRYLLEQRINVRLAVRST